MVENDWTLWHFPKLHPLERVLVASDINRIEVNKVFYCSRGFVRSHELGVNLALAESQKSDCLRDDSSSKMYHQYEFGRGTRLTMVLEPLHSREWLLVRSARLIELSELFSTFQRVFEEHFKVQLIQCLEGCTVAIELSGKGDAANPCEPMLPLIRSALESLAHLRSLSIRKIDIDTESH